MPPRRRQTFGLREVFVAWGSLVEQKERLERRHRMIEGVAHMKRQITLIEKRIDFDVLQGLETPKRTFDRLEETRAMCAAWERELCQQEAEYPPAPQGAMVGSTGESGLHARGVRSRSLSRRPSATSSASGS